MSSPKKTMSGRTGVAEAFARTFGYTGAPADVLQRQRELAGRMPVFVMAFEIVELMMRP